MPERADRERMRLMSETPMNETPMSEPAIREAAAPDPQSAQQLEAVRGWLRKKKPDLPEIDLDTDLIENRIVDSLLFVDFLFFLEQLAGRDLQDQARSVNPFRSLRSIRDQVLATR